MFKIFGNNGNPHWSPDSSKIAFVSIRTDHSFVGVYDLKKKKVTYMTPSVDRDTSPTWSEDGKSLAFIRRPGIPFGQQIQETQFQGANTPGQGAGRGQGQVPLGTVGQGQQGQRQPGQGGQAQGQAQPPAQGQQGQPQGQAQGGGRGQGGQGGRCGQVAMVKPAAFRD